MLEFNIAPNTQIGRIIIPEKVYEHENTYHIDEEKYSRGGEFIENMVTDNIVEYCKRWFHLAGFEEFLQDIDEYFGDRGFGKFSNLQKAGFGTITYTNQKVISPIEFNDNSSGIISPIIFNGSKPKDLNYQNIIERKKENATV